MENVPIPTQQMDLMRVRGQIEQLVRENNVSAAVVLYAPPNSGCLATILENSSSIIRQGEDTVSLHVNPGEEIKVRDTMLMLHMFINFFSQNLMVFQGMLDAIVEGTGMHLELGETVIVSEDDIKKGMN